MKKLSAKEHSNTVPQILFFTPTPSESSVKLYLIIDAILYPFDKVDLCIEYSVLGSEDIEVIGIPVDEKLDRILIGFVKSKVLFVLKF